MKNIIFSLTLLTIISSKLSAQTPDSTQVPQNTSIKTDSVKSDDDDETEFQIVAKIDTLPKWFYSIGLDGTTSSGNVNRQLLNFRTALSFESKKSIFGFFSTPKFQYGTNSDVLQERELFIDLNSTLFYAQSNVYILMFGGFEQSNLRKITTRYNAGLGVGLKIFGGKNHPKSRFKLSLTNAFVIESTDFQVKEDIEIFRNSTRLKISFEIIPNRMQLQSVAFLQPSLTDSYYRWNSLSSLTYKVGKHIAFLVSFDNTYENLNIAGIQNAQTNATIGLMYSGSN
jgi:putative salt-induced outer membrane protein YdiY